MNIQLIERLEQEYQAACSNISDINQHLPTLKRFADQCQTVTEFGVRWGASTRAFLRSNATKIRLYDLFLDAGVQELVSFCQINGKDVSYNMGNTLELNIEPTDLLFIDTLHTYEQLLAELQRHSGKVNKYIAFHDTLTFGCVDEGHWGGPGLLTALVQWLADNPDWRVVYHTYFNNGLTVVARVDRAVTLQGP
jgi:cephalosporin hydroxylase